MVILDLRGFLKTLNSLLILNKYDQNIFKMLVAPQSLSIENASALYLYFHNLNTSLHEGLKVANFLFIGKFSDTCDDIIFSSS